MRLKRNRLRAYHHRKMMQEKDSEGGAYAEYAPAVRFLAEMWPGGGKTQTKMYGSRLPNIRNLRIQGEYREVTGAAGKISYEISGGPSVSVNDGICLYTDADAEPDYKVIAIYPYRFLTLEVEKI